jgi:hypothetical protein
MLQHENGETGKVSTAPNGHQQRCGPTPPGRCWSR